MRILLANYRYFVSGGPERYMFNVTDALTERGHEVVPFSVHYTLNHPTPYSRYFVEPLGSRDEVYFRQQQKSLKTTWRTFRRLFYDPYVRQGVERLVVDTQPQVAYVLHYLRKLSPAVLVGLKRAKLPIVVRLSDYAMLCPQAHCLRDNVPCELCLSGNLWPSIQHRCLRGSLAGSVLNATATSYHRAMHYFDLIDVFVTTTRFMYEKMMAANYPESRLAHIPTFVDSTLFRPSPGFAKDRYIVYAGRITPIKGIDILIEALGILKVNRPDLEFSLKVAGSGEPLYTQELQQRVQQLGLTDQVQFLGELDTDALVDVLGRAWVAVVPSVCYENLPNVVLESYACGTPVLASRLGMMNECVEDGQTGYLYAPGEAKDLAERMAFCLTQPMLIAEMGRKARQVAETTYSKEQHLLKLETLFMNCASAAKFNASNLRIP